MRRILLALVMLAVPGFAFAQVPNTRFINLVDTPATITFSAGGSARVPLDPATANVVNVTGFRKIYVRIGTSAATSSRLAIGKISGSTLSVSFSRPIDSNIQSYDVTGPQMTLTLFGPPNTTTTVQLWVYLTS
jgi:hypothetical protein